jgi:ribosome-binding factor A
MSSNKINRTNEDIQRVLATLLRNVKDPRVNQGMLSVTAVETTGDLRYSKVYLSVMGLESEKDLMKGLKSASGYLRRELGNSLQLRYTPELIFQLDKSIERGRISAGF